MLSPGQQLARGDGRHRLVLGQVQLEVDLVGVLRLIEMPLEELVR